MKAKRNPEMMIVNTRPLGAEEVVFVMPKPTTEDVRLALEEAERVARNPKAPRRAEAVRLLPLLRKALDVRRKQDDDKF